MTNDEFLALSEKTLAGVLETLKKKNSDYTQGSFDPFANFRVTEALGLSNAETGILIRMVDKIQRIKSFVAKGSLRVSNESVEDSLDDIIGYALLLKGIIKDKKLVMAPISEELRSLPLEEGEEVLNAIFEAERLRNSKELTITQPFMSGKKTSGAF